MEGAMMRHAATADVVCHGRRRRRFSSERDGAPQDQTRPRRSTTAPRAERRHLGKAGALRERRSSVGFAAETRDLVANARRKLQAKGVHLMVANDVTAEGAGFDVDTNIVTLIERSGPASSASKR
jgi:hypothetical protein